MPARDFERQASEIDETTWFFSRLFAGVELEPSLAERARSIIADSVRGLRAVRQPPASPWDHWDDAMQRYAARDLALGDLLPGPLREQFDRNASALRAHFDALRASVATQ